MDFLQKKKFNKGDFVLRYEGDSLEEEPTDPVTESYVYEHKHRGQMFW